MYKKVVVITENKSILDFLLSDVHVLKRGEIFYGISISELKKSINADTQIILINAEEYSNNEIFKMIDIKKRYACNAKILVILNEIDSNFISECLNRGVYDFIEKDSAPDIYNTRLLNCRKSLSDAQKYAVLSSFINSTNCIKPKTGLYTYKALKECYNDLTDLSFFRESTFAIIALDESTKTKIAVNRLAQNIKKILRQTDVVAQGSGRFYLMLPETNLNGAKEVIEKISDAMGNDIKIRSGIGLINNQTFTEIEKNITDCLKVSVLDDKLYVIYEEKFASSLLSNKDVKLNKHYKLFQKTYYRKLHSVIEPLFYRTEKLYSSKLPNVDVAQYANENECLFSLQKGAAHSKLILKYDGFSKILLKISHKGLDTPENTIITLPLNKFDDIILSKYLEQFYNEFCEN